MPRSVNMEQSAGKPTEKKRIPSNRTQKVTGENQGVSLYDTVSLAGLKKWAKELPSP